jgi:hypothetical protein
MWNSKLRVTALSKRECPFAACLPALQHLEQILWDFSRFGPDPEQIVAVAREFGSDTLLSVQTSIELSDAKLAHERKSMFLG